MRLNLVARAQYGTECQNDTNQTARGDSQHRLGLYYVNDISNLGVIADEDDAVAGVDAARAEVADLYPHHPLFLALPGNAVCWKPSRSLTTSDSY